MIKKRKKKQMLDLFATTCGTDTVWGGGVVLGLAIKQTLLTVVGRDHSANIAATETCSSQIVLMCRSAPLVDGEV